MENGKLKTENADHRECGSRLFLDAIKDHALTHVPEGYEPVNDGVVLSGDLIWTIGDVQAFMPTKAKYINCEGLSVATFHCVIRRVPALTTDD